MSAQEVVIPKGKYIEKQPQGFDNLGALTVDEKAKPLTLPRRQSHMEFSDNAKQNWTTVTKGEQKVKKLDDRVLKSLPMLNSSQGDKSPAILEKNDKSYDISK